MLEHVPHWLGQLLAGVRAGRDQLVIADPVLSLGDARLSFASPAFADGARLPERFTADGAGVSPPLAWHGAPEGTAGYALIVEDADAPTPRPLVHALVWGLPAAATMLAEGAIASDEEGTPEGGDVGRNSYLGEGWLPPDPPTGHGPHAYVFQLFALSDVPDLAPDPGRATLVDALAGRVLATGVLTGTYSRGEEAPVGPIPGAVAAA